MLDLLEQIQSETPLETERRSQESLDWFKLRLRKIRQPVNKLLTDDDFPVVARPELGKMYMYLYDAKYKQTMPYWDRFPLIICFDLLSDGFMGINLHYIAPRYRTPLLLSLYEIAMETDNDEERRVMLSYQLIKSVSTLRYAKPCVKRYLFSHIDSRISEIPMDYWDMMVMLPSQQFNVNANTVYAESREKF
jgi:hypothetical protein|tara:strand:- start:4603 stop:5178 length:576 start_codon:yes stop_codon:yes gene_type:complete